MGILDELEEKAKKLIEQEEETLSLANRVKNENATLKKQMEEKDKKIREYEMAFKSLLNKLETVDERQLEVQDALR